MDQVVATYTQMTAKIRERLKVELGRTWQQASEGSGAGCGDGEFSGLHADAETRTLPWWTLPGGVPDDQWSRVEILVGEIASAYGVHPKPEIIANRPNAHDVVYRKSDGARIEFGSGKNATLAAATGCHLTAEAHHAARPQPARGDRTTPQETAHRSGRSRAGARVRVELRATVLESGERDGLTCRFAGFR
jgi:hypothetical protein